MLVISISQCAASTRLRHSTYNFIKIKIIQDKYLQLAYVGPRLRVHTAMATANINGIPFDLRLEKLLMIVAARIQYDWPLFLHYPA